jgi:hypothetical protein
MRYQVTFRQRFNQEGKPSDRPQALLNLPDGVIEEGEIVEQIEPDSVHVEEDMEEDDDVLPFGSEVWEYVVCDERKDEFVNALEASEVVIEYESIEEEAAS